MSAVASWVADFEARATVNVRPSPKSHKEAKNSGCLRTGM